MEFFDATPAANAIQYVGPAPSLLADHNGDQEQQISVTFQAKWPTRSAWRPDIARAANWRLRRQDPNFRSGISVSPSTHAHQERHRQRQGHQPRQPGPLALRGGRHRPQPSLSTTPSAAGPIGTVLNDTATISRRLNPTGSIPSSSSGPMTPMATAPRSTPRSSQSGRQRYDQPGLHDHRPASTPGLPLQRRQQQPPGVLRLHGRRGHGSRRSARTCNDDAVCHGPDRDRP